MNKEAWGKWGKAIGETMRKEKDRIVDEVCDRGKVSDKKRRMLKRVVPITMVWPDGTVDKFGTHRKK